MQQTSSLSRNILLMLLLKHATTALPIGILVHVRSSLQTKNSTTTKTTPTKIATLQALARPTSASRSPASSSLCKRSWSRAVPVHIDSSFWPYLYGCHDHSLTHARTHDDRRARVCTWSCLPRSMCWCLSLPVESMLQVPWFQSRLTH